MGVSGVSVYTQLYTCMGVCLCAYMVSLLQQGLQHCHKFYENGSTRCEHHAVMSIPELQPLNREAFGGNLCRGQEATM